MNMKKSGIILFSSFSSSLSCDESFIKSLLYLHKSKTEKFVVVFGSILDHASQKYAIHVWMDLRTKSKHWNAIRKSGRTIMRSIDSVSRRIRSRPIKMQMFVCCAHAHWARNLAPCRRNTIQNMLLRIGKWMGNKFNGWQWCQSLHTKNSTHIFSGKPPYARRVWYPIKNPPYLVFRAPTTINMPSNCGFSQPPMRQTDAARFLRLHLSTYISIYIFFIHSTTARHQSS